MEKKQVEQFKALLEDRQRHLRMMMARTADQGRQTEEDIAVDIADRASNSYNKEFLFSQSHNERQLLQLVESALDRIRQGNYGECVSCGEDINMKRLEAVPWARHCRECQEKLEQGTLQTGT